MKLKKCPQCGSFNIVQDAITGRFTCKNCGYVGVFFYEKTIDEKAIKAKFKK